MLHLLAYKPHSLCDLGNLTIKAHHRNTAKQRRENRDNMLEKMVVDSDAEKYHFPWHLMASFVLFSKVE